MLEPALVDRLIDQFLEEDVGFFDLTSALLIPPQVRGVFQMNARVDMVVAGLDIAARVFGRRAPDAKVVLTASDGQRVGPGTPLATISGAAAPILTAERTALNLLQHLSGIATLTAEYVKRIEGTKAVLVDTRKTTPGLRAFEKYATLCGGARNHRLRLDGGIMIKDNHVAVCGSLTAAIKLAKQRVPLLTKVEVECDRLDQVAEALEGGADIVMLDNMDLATMREAVRMAGGRVILEASGGVNLDTIRGIAETGVDVISVGRITQSAPAVDIGLDVALDDSAGAAA